MLGQMRTLVRGGSIYWRNTLKKMHMKKQVEDCWVASFSLFFVVLGVGVVAWNSRIGLISELLGDMGPGVLG